MGGRGDPRARHRGLDARRRAGRSDQPARRRDRPACMKIGEGDVLAQWHLTRCAKQTRAPMYYLLDERTRLAGCHMIREAVEG